MASLKSASSTWMTMLPDTGEDRAVPPDIDELSTYPPSAAANPVMLVSAELRAALPIRRWTVAVRAILGEIGNAGTRGRAPPLTGDWAAPAAPAAPDEGTRTEGLASPEEAG